MENNRNKSKIIGTLLIVVIVVVVFLLGFTGYAVLKPSTGKDKDNQQQEEAYKKKNTNKVLGGSSSVSNQVVNSSANVPVTEKKDKKQDKEYLENYLIVGRIEIPKTKMKAEILEENDGRALEIAITKRYSTEGINKPGTTVLYGHNYRNSTFFSDNEKLEIGDKFYITDQEGNKVTYEIYNKFETSATDTSFYTKSSEMTEGKCEAILSTCTDDASTTDRRLIIQGREI